MNRTKEFYDSPNAYWIDSTKKTNYSKLNENINVDVVVIGGGIVGISTAYLLSKEGLKVAVLEANRILNGTTGHSTAKITSQHHLIYAKIKNQMGEELARQYADANETAIHLVANIVEENKIDCDFSWQPAYVYTQDDKYIQQLEEEVRVASSLGIKASYTEEIPLPFPTIAAMRFDNQAQFHPLKYLKVLAELVEKNGGYIFEQSEAIDISDSEPIEVKTRNGNKVGAEKVIIASHYPFFDGGGMYFTRIMQEKSYVVAITTDEKFPDGMYITAEDPTRSLRSQPYKNKELILVGGEHHKSGHGENLNIHYQNLLDFANQNFKVNDIPYRWSTQDCVTIDSVPYVGHLTKRSPNLYVATGFGKWGFTNSTASAMILRDLIIYGDNPWAEVYNPSRFNRHSIKNFVSQNLNVAKSFVLGKVAQTPEDIELEKGEAKIIGVDGQRVGAYKDENDEIHMVDITCTHLGCELKWNDAETSWDCPCHGSRFDFDGNIIEGPAINHVCHHGDKTNEVEAKIFK